MAQEHGIAFHDHSLIVDISGGGSACQLFSLDSKSILLNVEEVLFVVNIVIFLLFSAWLVNWS